MRYGKSLHHTFFSTYRVAHPRAGTALAGAAMSTLGAGATGTAISVGRYPTNDRRGFARRDASAERQRGTESSGGADDGHGGKSRCGETDHCFCFVILLQRVSKKTKLNKQGEDSERRERSRVRISWSKAGSFLVVSTVGPDNYFVPLYNDSQKRMYYNKAYSKKSIFLSISRCDVGMT